MKGRAGLALGRASFAVGLAVLSGCLDYHSDPTADFTGSPLSGPAPLTVHFTDRSTPGSDGRIDEYQWYFEPHDAGSTKQNPVHTFMKPGTYEVLLIVSASGSDAGDYWVVSDTKDRTNYVTVLPPADSTLTSGPPAR